MNCPKCDKPIRYGEPTVSMDANIGACAAGAGNWKQYHSACVAIPTFYGPTLGAAPIPIADAKVPMLDALNTPCPHCGKKPIDGLDFS